MVMATIQMTFLSNEHSYSTFDDKCFFYFFGEENNYIKAP